MADKRPVKAVYDGSDIVALAEFTTGDTTPIANGGTGATTDTGARTNLGLGNSATKDVGTIAGTVAAGDHNHSGVYQPVDSDLTAIAGLSSTGLIKRTGTGTATTVTITSAGEALLDDTDIATQRTTLGLGTGDSPQFTAIQLGHASDTTLARSAAGKMTIENVEVTTVSNTQTLTNKTLDNPSIINGYKEEIGTSVPSKLNPANGSIQIFTLAASIDWTGDDELEDGESILLMIKDGSDYVINTWPTMTWVGGSAPTLDTTKYTCVELWKASSTLYGALVGFA